MVRKIIVLYQLVVKWGYIVFPNGIHILTIFAYFEVRAEIRPQDFVIFEGHLRDCKCNSLIVL